MPPIPAAVSAPAQFPRAHEPFDVFASLRAHALLAGDRRALVALNGSGAEAAALTYAALDRRARALAVFLAERVAPGERVLVALDDTLAFVAALFGCAYAGAIAVPLPAPRGARDERGNGRLAALAADCAPRLAFAVAPLDERLAWIDPALVPDRFADAYAEREAAPDEVAFLQYTSGSTSEPRGVVVRRRNLSANLREIAEVLRVDDTAPFVTWLPHFHDMGLVGMLLLPLVFGTTVYAMSPLTFLKRPARWLEAISHHRAGTTAAPDFAYELCVRRIPPAARAGLDLSSLTVAVNGAEPIRAATLARFAAAFGPCGFSPSAWAPAYGLAEATLLVCGERRAAGPRELALADGTRVVACGVPRGPLRVVDPRTRAPLPAGSLGEILVGGPNVSDGYWQRPVEQVAVAGETLLATGDLGALVDGALGIAGRLKDVVIVDGRNLHAVDVEQTVARAVAEAVPGGCAAVGVELAGGERLIVALELERYADADRARIAADVRAAVLAEHELAPHDVVLLRANRLPRTTSGKLRRHRVRELYAAGELA